VVQEVAGDRRQGFFCGHSDDVTCVAVHPQRTLAASGQKGKDCCVLVWDVTKVKRGVSLNRHVARLKPTNASRGISGVDFSGDGKFLLAVGMDDQRTISVFDWREGVLVASCKAGHGDVSQVRFNPYLYSPMDHTLGIDASAKGCYTLVSYGGKQVKFWTLREFYGAEEAGLEGVSNFKGRPLKPRKEDQNLSLKYALEGTIGVLPSKANTPDVTALVIVNDNLNDGVPKSRLFFGTSAGSIYVWQQLEEGESIKRGGKSKARKKTKTQPIDGLVGSSWQPRGKLISVVMELHDSAIVDMDYIRINPYEGLSGADPSYMIERIISSGDDGIINVWLLNRLETSNSLPLDHLGYLELNKEYARTVCWDDGGHAAVLGTAENSVLLLSYEEEEIAEGEESEGFGGEGESIRPKIAIDVLMQSHNGKVRKLAVNPIVKSLVASISTDKIVRLWDFRDRSLLTCFVLPDAATSAAFSVDGRGLALGNERGELAIYECDELNQLVGNYPCRFTPADFAGAHWKMVFKRSIASSKNGKRGREREGERERVRRWWRDRPLCH
jgi:WD40 repeat protein